MIYFTSDLHFGHEAILRYSNRPFESLEHMHNALVKNWNNCIEDKDIVYVLGDLALCPYKQFVSWGEKLKGRKILIKGNHDSYSDGQYNKLGFDVYHEIKLKIAGNMCRLSHYPYALPWHKRFFAFKSELRFMDRRPPKIEGEFLLHGHTHASHKRVDNRIHVGTDAWNYSPVSIREIESVMNRKE
jgi:calcineurin-like phosphoesterase family protein